MPLNMQTMNRLWVVCVVGVALLLPARSQAEIDINFLGFHYHSDSGQPPGLELTITQSEPVLSGTWSASLSRSRRWQNDQRWFSIAIVDGNSRNYYGGGFNSSDVAFLYAGNKSWAGEQNITTPAGTLRLEGTISDKKASGDFTFTPDANYVQQAGVHLTAAPSPRELLELGLTHVSTGDIIGFEKSGLELRAGDVIRLKNFGVNPQYAAAVRKDQKFDVDEIIKLHNFGVPEKFPAAVKSAGYGFDAAQLVKLRNFGVSADDAIAWKQAGFDYDVEGLVKMRNFGVKPDFGKAVHGVFTNATSEELIKLRNFGVSKEFLTAVRKADANFTVEEIVRLRNFGVTADYILAWREAGFPYSADELIKLRNFGVPASYAAASNIPDRKPLSAEMLIKLRQRGLSAEEIRELRE